MPNLLLVARFNVNRHEIFVATKTSSVNTVSGTQGAQTALRKLMGTMTLKHRHSTRTASSKFLNAHRNTAINPTPAAKAPSPKAGVKEQNRMDRRAETRCFELPGCRRSFQMMCAYVWGRCKSASRWTMTGSYSAYLSTLFPQFAQRSSRMPSVFTGPQLFCCLLPGGGSECVVACVGLVFMPLKMKPVGNPHSTHTNFVISEMKKREPI